MKNALGFAERRERYALFATKERRLRERGAADLDDGKF